MMWSWLLMNPPSPGWGELFQHPNEWGPCLRLWTPSFYPQSLCWGLPWSLPSLLSGPPGILRVVSVSSYHNIQLASLTMESSLLLDPACSGLWSRSGGCVPLCRAWFLSWWWTPVMNYFSAAWPQVRVVLRVAPKDAARRCTGCADESPAYASWPLLLVVNSWSNRHPLAALTTHFSVCFCLGACSLLWPLVRPGGNSF